MKILIIKLGALGDVIMATALIRQIQTAHPQAEFWLLTTPSFQNLFADWPSLKVHAAPRDGLKTALSVVRWIRRHRFDRIYDLQGNDRTTLLCALSGVAERVGNHPRYPYTHHPTDAWQGDTHIFERMNAVLASAGVGPAPARPELPLSTEARDQVLDWQRQHGLQANQFVVLHAGASPTRPEKRWPHFRALGEALLDSGLTPVWVGGTDDADINQSLAADGGIDATGALSIAELAELGRNARCAVTNDSGPMHALSASDIPVYGLFGPSDWRRNHALGQADYVLHALELAQITPAMVMDRLREDVLLT